MSRKKERRRRFEVVVTVPVGVTVREMRDYVKEAIGIWCKSFDPESPIFDFSDIDLVVKPLPRPE